MHTILEQAIEIFIEENKKHLEKTIQKEKSEPCMKCQENIDNLKKNQNFKPKFPNKIDVPYEEEFEWNTEHAVRISEHMGMPCITTFDSCPTCHTEFYTSYEGFDSDTEFMYRTPDPKDISENISLLSVQKDILKQELPKFLNDYIKDRTENAILYVSLDENLRRSNHKQIEKMYKDDNKPLDKLDIVTCYLSERDALEDSRMGGIFEKEFIQRIQCPMNKIKFVYNSYLEKVEAKVDIKDIEKRLFFDIYRKNFVNFEEMDLENIHMVKRNHDTYEYFSELRSAKEYGGFEGPDLLEELLDKEFAIILDEILTNKFGEAYKKHKQKEKEKLDRWGDFVSGMKEFGKKKREENKEEEKPKPTELEGIKAFDNVIVKKQPYDGMKACVKRIDFNANKLEVLFFGEEDRDNVLRFAPSDCEKV